jgi:2-polyprenyl-3-methyl-5-hydroxy-6-metoxy-1,4-benzoquinol methylase
MSIKWVGHIKIIAGAFMENITADKVKPKYEQVKQIWAQMLSKYYDRPGHLNPQYLVDAPCSHCKSTAVDGEFVLNGFRHVTCTSCRTVYVTPRLKDACLEELYSDKYYSTFYAESMIPAFETRKRLIGTRKCEQVLKYSGTPNGRVLDIGCGIGEVIDAFRDKKWDCHAIEVNECAIKWLEEKKIRVFKGSFDVFPENEKFDVIMAWGVVEHVTNPKEFLKKVLRHLKPGGLFASEVPNGQCLLVDYCRKTLTES